MLLTLSQTGKPEFGIRPPHELASTPPPHSSYSSYHSPRRPLDNILAGIPHTYAMSTSHRGLPPPSAMTLPEPNRSQPSGPPPPPPPPGPPQALQSIQSQPKMGPMPAPPNQWQGGDDAMRNWLNAKAEEERTKQEEERRRQEEERTRQESFKLEQRMVEQSILRESMKGGVPPQMIPVIFAGIGGSNLVNVSVELLHQYAAQLQTTAQQMQQHHGADVSPEQVRETRIINPPQPNPYAAPPQPQSAPSQQTQPPPPPPPPLSQHQTTFSVFAPSGRGNASSGPTSAPRSVPASTLSRLNTIDLAQSGSSNQPSSLQSHGSHAIQSDQPTSSPSIYFHHWVPPATQESKGNQPPTPSGRNEPTSAHPSHSGEADFRDSPRKRKAIGGHHPVPPPPPSQTSPSFSSQSSSRSRGNSITGHMRSRSNKSNEDHTDPLRRPPSRRDSVATNPRVQEAAGYGPDPHSRSASHLSHHSSHMSKEHIR